MHQKLFGGWALSRPAAGVYKLQRSLIPLTGFKEQGPRGGEGQ